MQNLFCVYKKLRRKTDEEIETMKSKSTTIKQPNNNIA